MFGISVFELADRCALSSAAQIINKVMEATRHKGMDTVLSVQPFDMKNSPLETTFKCVKKTYRLA